ncbi:MAG: diacylglycerol kinase family protein, partial [Myxococcota bacterium]
PGVVIRTTTGPGHATALAREAKEAGAAQVVACGGDGTVFEVVNGLLPGPGPVLGILPVGTGNSFVRDLGLADERAAVAAIRAGTTRQIDAMRIVHADGELFSVNLLSLGFSADAGAMTNRRFKPLGAAGYVAAVLASLVRLRHHAFPYAIDDGLFDARPGLLLSVCNSRYTGGAMMMAPFADPTDGQLDVVRIGSMRRRRFLMAFPMIFQGTHLELPEVRSTRGRSVAFADVGPVPVMIDGEVRTLALRSVAVVRRALEVSA